MHYNKNDVKHLKNDVLQKKSNYNITMSKFDFFQYMSAVNFYNDLTGILLCIPEDICKLKNYIFRTEYWGWDEIITFGNTLGLLSNANSYFLCTELLSQIQSIEKIDFFKS